MGKKGTWHISDDGIGIGGFLCPPGHWNHRYKLWYGLVRDRAIHLETLDYEEDLPTHIANQIAKIKSDARLVCSEKWLRHFYQYYQYAYAPASGSRNVNACVIDRTNSLPPTRHLGYLMVRQFFPDHEVRMDLIAGDFRGYNQHPCRHCGKRVQYEARIDAYQPFAGNVSCIVGMEHEWEDGA